MKIVNLTVMLALFLSQPLIAIAQESGPIVRDISLTGPQMRILEVAAAEFRKKGLDVLKYKVSLYRAGTSYVVLFEDPDISETQLGSSPRMPSFEVEVDLDYKVLGANFAR